MRQCWNRTEFVSRSGLSRSSATRVFHCSMRHLGLTQTGCLPSSFPWWIADVWSKSESSCSKCRYGNSTTYGPFCQVLHGFSTSLTLNPKHCRSFSSLRILGCGPKALRDPWICGCAPGELGKYAFEAIDFTRSSSILMGNMNSYEGISIKHCSDDNWKNVFPVVQQHSNHQPSVGTLLFW